MHSNFNAIKRLAQKKLRWKNKSYIIFDIDTILVKIHSLLLKRQRQPYCLVFAVCLMDREQSCDVIMESPIYRVSYFIGKSLKLNNVWDTFFNNAFLKPLEFNTFYIRCQGILYEKYILDGKVHFKIFGLFSFNLPSVFLSCCIHQFPSDRWSWAKVPGWVILEDSGHSFSFDPDFVKLLWNVGSSVVILKGTTWK